jgi:hypothetical protein
MTNATHEAEEALANEKSPGNFARHRQMQKACLHKPDFYN